MKILIDIGHPVHVPQFRNAIKILKAKGHEILVTARNKEITLDLLDRFGMKYEDDTEHAVLQNLLSYHFASAICTPSCYKKDLGKKQIRYNGYHELAYLRPNYFTPNPAVLDEMGLSKDDTFIILRFDSWSTSHDVWYSGLTLETKRNAVHEFEKYGRVFITSESLLPEEFEKYRITISPEKMHDLLYYATDLVEAVYG